MSINSSDPMRVARETAIGTDPSGDSADQAERLSMIMEAEAIRNAIRGEKGDFAGEGSLAGFEYPLEDIREVLALEDAADSSDDPVHSGGLTPSPWIPAENAAMHIMGSEDALIDGEIDEQQINPYDS
jgi:hypothetical protein